MGRVYEIQTHVNLMYTVHQYNSLVKGKAHENRPESLIPAPPRGRPRRPERSWMRIDL